MRKLSLLLLAFAGALLLAGCSSLSSMEHRAARYPQTWAKLSDTDKERVRHGEFKPGDSMKLVYIGHGAPDDVRRDSGAAGHGREIWIWEVPKPRWTPAEATWPAPHEPGSADGSSWKYYAGSTGPFAFENGMLVRTAPGLPADYPKVKLQLPEREKL